MTLSSISYLPALQSFQPNPTRNKADPSLNRSKRKNPSDYGSPKLEKRAKVRTQNLSQSSSSTPWSCHSPPKLIIVLVGLPARGKSYIARKLCRYLNWLQYGTRIFNVGDKRRHLKNLYTQHNANFFDPADHKAAKIREVAAMATLEELLDFLLLGGGSVALFDATNTTLPRRRAIVERVKQRTGSQTEILFLESQCFDEELLESNMMLKLSGPDYKGHDPKASLADFKERVSMYSKKYTSLGSAEESLGWSFCQMIDVGRKFVMHNIQGYLAFKTVQYIQNFHLQPRQIWLSRRGESADDALEIETLDPELSERGREYATALATFIHKHRTKGYEQKPSSAVYSITHGQATSCPTSSPKFQIWTSRTARSRQTSSGFARSEYLVKHLHMLDSFNGQESTGDHHESGSSTSKVLSLPDDNQESHSEIAHRIQWMILELERLHDHVLLIAGVAVLRVLLAYFRDVSQIQLGRLEIPLHTLYLLEPKPYGIELREFKWDSIDGDFHEVHQKSKNDPVQSRELGC
ncbi:hypothetical protein LTR84_010384 [Exophiala bonariae]|uniref:6-phosphofructo-2-kinase domain-containing protein n=1 Tax=Exophiala bonariae TaxID=1690606 RepID=A0AAV9MTB8_9EURO|nr:hypothetical protein LTR84_010384 [Exophiala bonariae]